ncbi:hypothetical protein SFRURICE_003254 [Spodoptera frugiperda]|nr:hypothetical protein SFRURICE_003254 [Spodoptera frugiperda]
MFHVTCTATCCDSGSLAQWQQTCTQWQLDNDPRALAVPDRARLRARRSKSSVDKPVIVLFNILSAEHLAATKDAFEPSIAGHVHMSYSKLRTQSAVVVVHCDVTIMRVVSRRGHVDILLRMRIGKRPPYIVR